MSAHIDLQDQVPRKLAYLREHPGTDIIAPCRHEPMWEATLDDGNMVIQAPQLSLRRGVLWWCSLLTISPRGCFLRLIIRVPLGGRLCSVSPKRKYAHRVVPGTDGVESVVLVG